MATLKNNSKRSIKKSVEIDLEEDDFVTLADILSSGRKSGTINKPVKSKPNSVTSKPVDSLKDKLSKEIKKVEKKLAKLKMDQGLLDDGRIFVFRKSYSMDEIRDWCFEQNIVFKMENASILGTQVRLLIFRTKEDAMGFKLAFL